MHAGPKPWIDAASRGKKGTRKRAHVANHAWRLMPVAAVCRRAANGGDARAFGCVGWISCAEGDGATAMWSVQNAALGVGSMGVCEFLLGRWMGIGIGLRAYLLSLWEEYGILWDGVYGLDFGPRKCNRWSKTKHFHVLLWQLSCCDFNTCD